MAATIKCDTLQNTSSATANVTLDGSGNATVGNNLTITGQTIPSSSFKRNRIINGNMQVWQRATTYTGTPSSATYTTVDRWACYCAASTTYSQSTSVPTTAGSLFQYSLKAQRPAAAVTTNPIFVVQAIESINCYDLASSSVTYSFWLKAGANFSGGTVSTYVNTGTAADQGVSGAILGTWTGVTSPVVSTITPTTTWTKYTATGTFGSGVLEAALLFYFTPSGPAGADDSIYITGVQLEVGSAATPYERQIYSDQLAQCQRYYYKMLPGGAFVPFGVGYCTATTSATSITIFPVTLRVAPTALEQSGTASDYRVYTNAGTTCSSVPAIASGSGSVFSVSTVFTVVSGLTAGDGSYNQSLTSAAYLAWSAEL